MSNPIEILALASACAAIASSPAESCEFTAQFDYAPSAQVEATYEQFEKIAKRACFVGILEAGGIGMKNRIEQPCRENLLARAVLKTGDTSLIAYHEATSRSQTVAHK